MSRLADPDTEARVIGAVLGTPSLYARIGYLAPDCFTVSLYQEIWTILESLHRNEADISCSEIAGRSGKEIASAGGIDALEKLAIQGERAATSIEAHANRIQELAQWREIGKISARLEAVVDRQDKSPKDILSGLIEHASTLLTRGRGNFQTKSEVARKAMQHAIEKKRMVTTGITTLDYLFQGGLRPGRLYGLGGPTGRGKTIMLGSISENLSLQDEKHLFISLETDPTDIEIRSCARHLGLNASSIYDTHDPDHVTFVQSLSDYIAEVDDNVIYDFRPGATLEDIHRSILAAKTRYGISGFMLDYWQLVRGRARGEREDEHFRNVADTLAAICRREGLWGMVTAQLDDRGAPKLSDSILQSASLFVRLVRDENGTEAYFETVKSNYTRYADTGTESVPGMIFDPAGPHFRNTAATDIPDLVNDRDGEDTQPDAYAF